MAWNADRRTIILEPGTLSEEYLPDKMGGRESQINHLMDCLAPALKNQKPLQAWLHGLPGTGKTATAKSLAHEIHKRSKVRYIHVNCRKQNSFYAILDFIVNELRAGFGDERDGRIKLQRIEQYVKDKPLIIILDEIDFLPPRERSSLLYNLSFGNVGLLCISETRNALFSLNGRTKSRLQPHLIEFRPYTPAEITDILQERAFAALAQGSWNPETLEKIARLAEGDARVAIQTLRSAAEFAETQGSQVISVEHIDMAFSNTREIRKSYLLKKLGDHYRILYSLIEVKGGEGVLSTNLWDLYQAECRAKALEPVAKRTFSYYLNRMTQFKLIEAKRARLRGHVYAFSIQENGKPFHPNR